MTPAQSEVLLDQIKRALQLVLDQSDSLAHAQGVVVHVLKQIESCEQKWGTARESI
jgi:hypothetical protein